MIKFFRHIRKSLINQNQMGKYVKYAFGEILLVVIGILIALQINNWNQNRLEKIKSVEYHKRMVEDLDLLIRNFKWDSTRSSNMTKRLITSLKVLEKKKATKGEMDTLDYSLRNYFQFVRINTSLNTFDEIKSSGDIGLIYNKDLRKSINSYLTYLSAIGKIYDELSEQVNERAFLDPYIKQEVNLTSSNTKIKFDFNTIRKNKMVINQLSRYAHNWSTKREFASSLIEQSKKLRAEILKELNND
ncbi:MAG: hypothetical protein CMB99_07485 [Flavobacteriaceae bacterium]|nr:hypothetical protein [Flavobacteriaceae bacterium]|tara:strand:+ start:101147 stop:101881 length:735 start_codon:yes stop_codon:yes gene_type:complete